MAFFNLSPDLFCVISTDRFFKYLNPAWESVLGWSHDELFGKPLEGFIHPDDVEGALSEFDSLGDKLSATFEARFRHMNGSVKWLEWRAILWVEGGNIYGVARDITKRKKIEEVVMDGLYIFDNMKVAVMRGSPDAKKIEFANPAFAKMHGYTVEEMVGKPLIDVISPDYRAEFPEHVNLASEKEYYVFQGMHIRKDGSTFPAHKEVIVVKDEKGRIKFRFCFVKEIKELDSPKSCCA